MIGMLRASTRVRTICRTGRHPRRRRRCTTPDRQRVAVHRTSSMPWPGRNRTSGRASAPVPARHPEMELNAGASTICAPTGAAGLGVRAPPDGRGRRVAVSGPTMRRRGRCTSTVHPVDPRRPAPRSRGTLTFRSPGCRCRSDGAGPSSTPPRTPACHPSPDAGWVCRRCVVLPTPEPSSTVATWSHRVRTRRPRPDLRHRRGRRRGDRDSTLPGGTSRGTMVAVIKPVPATSRSPPTTATPTPTPLVPAGSSTRQARPEPGPSGLTAEEMADFVPRWTVSARRILDSLGEDDAAYIRRVIDTPAPARGRRSPRLAGSPGVVAGDRQCSPRRRSSRNDGDRPQRHARPVGLDATRDPLHHREWDNTCPSSRWKHTHNQTIVGTNVLYGTATSATAACASPAISDGTRYLAQPVCAAVLGMLFQWASPCTTSRSTSSSQRRRCRGVPRASPGGRLQGRPPVLKDYVAFPLLAGRFFLRSWPATWPANLGPATCGRSP